MHTVAAPGNNFLCHVKEMRSMVASSPVEILRGGFNRRVQQWRMAQRRAQRQATSDIEF